MKEFFFQLFKHFGGFNSIKIQYIFRLKIALFVADERAIFFLKKVACEFILSRQIASSGHPG
jgi:hypothetical protein